MPLPNLNRIPLPNPSHKSHFPLPNQLAPPCDMLPPLLPTSTTNPNTPSLTLSDCSDLSVSPGDDSNLIHQPYLPHPPTLANPPPVTVPPPPPTPPTLPALPETVSPPKPPLRPTPPGLPAMTPAKVNKNKAIKKHARTRTKLPSKVPSSSTPTPEVNTPVKYRPMITKKVRSSKSNIPGESRYWTPSEHRLFVEALLKYGPKDLKSIAAYVGTRNMIQCRTHEQKCFMRLMREAQRDTMIRNGQDPDGNCNDPDKKYKPPKDVYSVPSSCGLSLLSVVSEEMTRALQD